MSACKYFSNAPFYCNSSVCSLIGLGQTGVPRAKRSATCYGDLGCFSNTIPFNNTDGLLPQVPDFINTVFRLDLYWLISMICQDLPSPIHSSSLFLLILMQALISEKQQESTNNHKTANKQSDSRLMAV